MVYSALEPHHIRVLKLEPSPQDDAVISCSLVPISLLESDSLQYEALSYVWGDPSERDEILLDGQPTSITRSLWGALKHIRNPDASRTLWIDAVCINQQDVHERNNQVKQMGRIYSQASRVLIWLGPPDTQIEKTMLSLSTPGVVDVDSFEQFPKQIVLGLRRILSQPWWHRIWVLQEHVLATSDPIVGCGCTWIEWTQLFEAILHYSRSMIDESGSTIVDENSTWTSDPFAVMRHILLRKQWNDPEYFSETRTSIGEIVERTRGYQATDKRDQVFAIRELLSNKDKDLFPTPDYTRSVSEVYQEATVAYLRNKRSLAFLMHAVKKDEDELPSWCVDFSKRLWDWGAYGNLAGGQVVGDREESDETKEYINALAHEPSLGTLKVLGGVLGEIIMSRPIIPPEAFDQGQITAVIDSQGRPVAGNGARKLWVLTQFVKEVLKMSVVYCKIWEDRHGVEKAKQRLGAGEVWKTIFGGILFNLVDAACIRAGIETVDGDDRPRDYWVVEAFVRKNCPWYADAIEGMGYLQPTPELADSPRLYKALWETLILVTQTNIGNWWFVTNNGYVGCVDRELEGGDQLCAIFGCRAPLILRTAEDNFRLVAMPQSEDFVGENHRTRLSEIKREVFTLQ